MPSIIPFSFAHNQVRVVTDETGEPFFVGKDVCTTLGYTNTNKAMNKWLASMQAKGEMLRIRAEDMMAVIEEFDDAEEHAELMEEFSYADWGITEADLIKQEDLTQPNLFDQGGGVK